MYDYFIVDTIERRKVAGFSGNTRSIVKLRGGNVMQQAAPVQPQAYRLFSVSAMRFDKAHTPKICHQS